MKVHRHLSFFPVFTALDETNPTNLHVNYHANTCQSSKACYVMILAEKTT